MKIFAQGLDRLMDAIEAEAEAMLRARLLLIEHGYYRIMPIEEALNTFTTSGRPPYEFRYNGEAYTTDHTIEAWQWP